MNTDLTGQPGYGWDMTDKPFLTIREVADLLQVSNRTVYNLYIIPHEQRGTSTA